MNFGGAVNTRRVNALNRLQSQLKEGAKEPSSGALSKLGHTEYEKALKSLTLTGKIPLTPADVVRINKEIAVLQSRITSEAAAASRRTKKYRGGSGFTR